MSCFWGVGTCSALRKGNALDLVVSRPSTEDQERKAQLRLVAVGLLVMGS